MPPSPTVTHTPVHVHFTKINSAPSLLLSIYSYYQQTVDDSVLIVLLYSTEKDTGNSTENRAAAHRMDGDLSVRLQG